MPAGYSSEIHELLLCAPHYYSPMTGSLMAGLSLSRARAPPLQLSYVLSSPSRALYMMVVLGGLAIPEFELFQVGERVEVEW